MNPTDPYTQSVPFFRRLRQANIKRQQEWAGSDKVDYQFRAIEFGGEAGELLNAIKKFDRMRQGVLGNTETTQEIVDNLIEEIGDVVICLDLLCIALGEVGYPIDVEKATRSKFNKTSRKHKLQTLLFNE